MSSESRPPLGATRDTLLRTLTWLALGAVSFGGAYALTLATKSRPGAPSESAPAGMVWIPPGEFTMGTDAASAWDDEKPAHQVAIEGFWMDEHEVTNAQFREFIEATGYVTTAEKAPDIDEIMAQVAPGTAPPDPKDLVPGSLVFTPTEQSVKLDDFTQWWRWTPGASWKHPEGPGSSLAGRENHPVVQVSWDDAKAYADWAGKRLPTEAEWERAARGGLERQPYAWGTEVPDEEERAGKFRANLWQGSFPTENSAGDGFERTAPVKSFPPNGFGLYDMAGNVWEWCSDWYQRDLYKERPRDRVTRNPKGPGQSSDSHRPFTPQRSQKGGSFLCNDAYCSRYRPSARHGCSPDTGMSHVGFRCAKSPQTQGQRP